MIRFKLFFIPLISLLSVLQLAAQQEARTAIAIVGETLELFLTSEPYRPQIMNAPLRGTASWEGSDNVLGLTGENTLYYTPSVRESARDTFEIGYWKFTEFGPAFTQRSYYINIIEHGNILEGTVFFDENEDCEKQGGEQILRNRLITLQSETETIYTNSNSEGQFRVILPVGDYEVTQIGNAPAWQPCGEGQFINSPESDTLGFLYKNIAAQATVTLPFLQVDITTPLLRRCFDNVYHVSYCNDGALSVNGAYVEVELDPFLSYQGSTVPLASQVNNLLRFDLETLEVDECGDFKIFVNLSCEAALGQTHCVEANIYPQPIILGPQLDVSGACLGDKLQFVIKNIGEGDMEDSVQWFVIEEQVVYLKEDISLEAGDSIIVTRPANGRTIRVEVEQVASFPYGNKVGKSIEGCISDPSDDVSQGMINRFAQSDAAPYQAIDCTQNRGSFDPNDKQVFPIGIGTNHYIEANTDLEYLIRFQNTGTDTAFTVVIRDTLSNLLDINSLQIGAASHDFTWTILSERTLEFTFNHILLPDSTTHEEASHGFIKFRISQKVNNPVNSEIENHAAIFFDFNEPVITNTVFNIVGEKFLNIASEELIELLPWLENTATDIEVNVFPNPAREKVYFMLPVSMSLPAKLLLYNVRGQLIEQLELTERLNGFSTMYWKENMYIYQVIGEEQTSQGRLFILNDN